MLKLENLTKKFGHYTAVNNINIEINGGDIFGFLGPNGAGKTTTIKMIVGLYSPTAGAIYFDGEDVSNDPVNIKKHFGYVPDQPYIYDKLTGKEFLYFSGGLYNLSKIIIKNRIEELIDLMKIGDWINKRTEEYSQGMKQRITFASAFLHNPKMLVIDEPMIGLDPQSAHIVKQVLKNKAKEGMAIFMSTHSLNVAEEICTRVGIIHKSQMIFDNSIDVLHNMKKEMERNFEELFIELTQN